MSTGWQRFEWVAGQRPAAPAIVQGGTKISFGQLHALALRQARALQVQGVGPNDRVAVCAEKGMWRECDVKVDIPIRTTVAAFAAFSAQPEFLAFADARRNSDLQRATARSVR